MEFSVSGLGFKDSVQGQGSGAPAKQTPLEGGGAKPECSSTHRSPSRVVGVWGVGLRIYGSNVLKPGC